MLDGRNAGEAFRTGDGVQVEAAAGQVGAHLTDRFGQFCQEAFGRPHGIDRLLAAAGVRPNREGCQRLAQRREDAAVVHDQAVVLALVDPVGAGDGLHQGVGFLRLVQVEVGEAGHVEAGQPHGADDRDPERVIGILERQVDVDPLAVGSLVAFLDLGAVRHDVQVVLPKQGDLVLFFADDDRDLGLAQPVQLADCVGPAPGRPARA